MALKKMLKIQPEKDMVQNQVINVIIVYLICEIYLFCIIIRFQNEYYSSSSVNPSPKPSSDELEKTGAQNYDFNICEQIDPHYNFDVCKHMNEHVIPKFNSSTENIAQQVKNTFWYLFTQVF